MNALISLAADPSAWAALATLITMEVVLGIDNLIFISILTNKLPEHLRSATRRVGIGLALVLRLGLLGTVAVIVQLTEPVFTVFGHGFSWRDLILIGGGLFLISKATHEIHSEIEAREAQGGSGAASPRAPLTLVIVQLIAIDLVFSLDSIITAIGMAEDIEVMVAAIVIAMVVMYVASGPVTDFIVNYPTTKMLALAFLVLIGVALVADGFKFHIPRGYIYFAITFSAAVEFFNVLAKSNRRKS
jgi:predicted tellurium resistance membrane protein TerC